VADLSFEIDSVLHKIGGSLEISHLLIDKTQIPAGNCLAPSVSDLAGDGHILFVVQSSLPGIAQSGIGISQVSQVGPFASFVPDLAVNLKCLLMVQGGLSCIAQAKSCER
jgi:hypothetical protein